MLNNSVRFLSSSNRIFGLIMVVLFLILKLRRRNFKKFFQAVGVSTVSNREQLTSKEFISQKSNKGTKQLIKMLNVFPLALDNLSLLKKCLYYKKFASF